MFTIFHSNKTDLLNTIIASQISIKPLQNPFEPEIIIIENNNIARWLQIKLTVCFGITANIKFFSSSDFLWQIYSDILSDTVVNKNIFSKTTMFWKIMRLLPILWENPNFSIIKQYCFNDYNSLKLFQLSMKVTDLFHQYLLFRFDWLEKWQNGYLIKGLDEKTQLWQMLLWRSLISETNLTKEKLNLNHANYYRYFTQILEQSKKRPLGLPSRIFVYNPSFMFSLTYLEKLSRYVDIYLLFNNPCRYYWSDVCDYFFLSKLLKRTRCHYKSKQNLKLFRDPKKIWMLFDKNGKQLIVNPLLASWGKQGKDNLYILSQLQNAQEIDAFVQQPGNSLLNFLQRDILELENSIFNVSKNYFKKNKDKHLLFLKDCSLSIHVCHSIQREVEILHDNLIIMMNKDKALQMRDIIIMVPNINDYIPSIQSVFGSIINKNYSSLSFSNSYELYSKQVLPTFFCLLEIFNSKFTVKQVLSFLEIPIIAARFSISEKSNQLLRYWIIESGIRWGLDNDSTCKMQFSALKKHTWEFGLTRILLGYAMYSQSGSWKGMLPFDIGNDLDITLVGQLWEFFSRLRFWRNKFYLCYTIEVWLSFIYELIDDFFILSSGIEEALILLKNKCYQILKNTIEIKYHKSISITLLYEILSTILKKQSKDTNEYYLSGINLYNLGDMRSIPFKVVCLLGMNDGIYPRIIKPLEFNLMLQQKKIGDYSRPDDDRYVFLEALLSAQDQLYISFVGYDIQNNVICYPSVLVTELSNYITENFYLPDNNFTLNKTNSNIIYKYLWHEYDQLPFTTKYFFNDKTKLNSKKIALFNKIISSNNLCSSSLYKLTVNDIYFFYSHPVRMWFQKRGIFFTQMPYVLPENEIFVVDDLTRYRLNVLIVNAIIKKENIDLLYQKICSAGLLPYGAFGKIFWMKQFEIMSFLATKIQKDYLSEKKKIEVMLSLESFSLSGYLSNVQINGIRRWRPANLTIKDGLLLWLEHLIYCAIGGKGDSKMFGIRGQWHFTSLCIDQAKQYLLSFINGYYKGMINPLLLIHKFGESWLNSCFDFQNKCINKEKECQEKARNKLIKSYDQNILVFKDKTDQYLEKIIKKLDEKQIEDIILAAECYLLPPIIHNLFI